MAKKITKCPVCGVKSVAGGNLCIAPTACATFMDRLHAFVALAEEVAMDAYKRTCPALVARGWGVALTVETRGTKNFKIVRHDTRDGGEVDNMSKSVHCFVEKATGNILKAASWTAPAKHARGNIFNEDWGVGAVGPYGANYMR